MQIDRSNSTRQYKDVYRKHKNTWIWSFHLMSNFKTLISIQLIYNRLSVKSFHITLVTVKCFKNKLEIQVHIDFLFAFFAIVNVNSKQYRVKNITKWSTVLVHLWNRWVVNWYIIKLNKWFQCQIRRAGKSLIFITVSFFCFLIAFKLDFFFIFFIFGSSRSLNLPYINLTIKTEKIHHFWEALILAIQRLLLNRRC